MLCLYFCTAPDISATMVELCRRTTFSPFGGDILSLGVTKCGVKKRAWVDHFWPLR